MKIYRYLSYTVTALLIILTVYICIIYVHKRYEINRIKLFDKQQAIAAKKLQINQAFVKPKNIPLNKPVQILVLEGGGINGIISAKILDYIEKTSNKHTSDLFDAIYGTSIGGLQATFLTLPDKNGNPKYTAANLLEFMREDAATVLNVDILHAFLSGFGFISPIIKPDAYIKLLKTVMGDTQISQLTTTVLITGYDLEKNEIQFFSSRQDMSNQPNFLMYQLLAGTTAIVGAFPPQRIFSLSNEQNYLLADPNLIINNPVMAALIHANIMYPKNEKIIVFVGLGQYKETKEADFYNGFLGGAYEYVKMMRSGSPDKLLNLYIDILQADHRLGLKENDTYYINAPVNFSIGNSLDSSPDNIKHLENIADIIISAQKPKLSQLIKKLTNSTNKDGN